MARVRAPLLSIEASGTVGKVLTFQRYKHLFSTRKIPRASKSATPDQLVMRNKHKFALWAWTNLTDAQRTLWNLYELKIGVSGFHAFMSLFKRLTHLELPQYQLPTSKTYCLAGEWFSGDVLCGGTYIEEGFLQSVRTLRSVGQFRVGWAYVGGISIFNY